MDTRKKFIRSNAQQIQMLVDHMLAHQDFAAGDFKGPLGFQKMDREWANMQQTLNAHGPQKTVEQWKNTWRDLKKKARKEAAAHRRAQDSTGNVGPVPKISDITAKILSVIGPEIAVGIGPPESVIDFQTDGTLPAVTPRACPSPAGATSPTHEEEIGVMVEPPVEPSEARPIHRHPKRRKVSKPLTEFGNLQDRFNIIMENGLSRFCAAMERVAAALEERNKIEKEKVEK